MSIAKQKIQAVADQINLSDLRQSHKNDIQDMLIATGDATNGVSDKQHPQGSRGRTGYLERVGPGDPGTQQTI